MEASLEKKCQLCENISEDDLIQTSLDISVCMRCWQDEFDCSYLSQYIGKINDKIFLGNKIGQTNKRLLKSLGITHILVVGKELAINFPEDFIYKRIPVEDDENEKISNFFEESYYFSFR